MIEKRCVNNKTTLFVTEHCPKVLLFGTKTTSKKGSQALGKYCVIRLLMLPCKAARLKGRGIPSERR